jgi:hypothetical protein
MLCEVVGVFVLAAFPVDLELILVGSITNPIKLHVHCCGTTLFEGVVDDVGWPKEPRSFTLEIAKKAESYGRGLNTASVSWQGLSGPW